MATAKCDQCGIHEHIHLLDAKPEKEGDTDFNRLECIRCYGPFWLPCAVEHLSLSIAPELKPYYDEWKAKQ